MNRIEVGMRVLDVAGRRVGVVVERTDPAYRVQHVNGGESWLTAESIFTVEGTTVALVCDIAGVAKYAPASSDNVA